MNTFTKLKTILLSALTLFLFNMGSFAQDCPLFEDFENLSPEAAYAGRIVTTPSGDWMILGYSQMDNNDRRIDAKSIRLRANNSDPAAGAMSIPGENTEGANVVQMQFDKPNGVGEVSFYYGSYSGHSGGKLFVEYSTDAGNTWMSPNNNSIVAPSWAEAGEMLPFSVIINIQGNVRVRVIKYKQSGTQNSVNIDNLCATDFNQAGYTAAPTFNPPGGSYTDPVNVTITSTTEGAIIRYTLDGTDPQESSTTYSAPVALSTQTTLKAKAWKEGMEPSVVSTANYIFPQGVSTLAELRALAPPYNNGTNAGTAVYTYTGQAIVTHTQPYRNVKYIQDATGAMYIYDVTGKIQAGIEVGDKITNLSGTLTNYFGMIELIPTGECDVVDYLKKVQTTVITASQLDYDYNNPIQAKIITIKDVMFTQTGVFENGKYYDLKEGIQVHDSVVYTDNYDTDYIGDPIPTILLNINGVINFKGGAGIPTRNRIVPLDKSNNVIGTDQNISTINKSAITLAPNPANSFVNIVTGSPMKLEVFSLIGNRIAVESLYEGTNTISVSNYPSGLYLMKLTDANTGQTFVQKLVVK